MNTKDEDTGRPEGDGGNPIAGVLSRLADGAKGAVDRGRARIDDVRTTRTRGALLRDLGECYWSLCATGDVEPHDSCKDLLDQLATLDTEENPRR